MSKSVLVFVLLFVTSLSAQSCSIPDEAHIDALENEVRTMPDEDYNAASAWVFQNVVSKYMWDNGADEAIHQKCYDGAGNKVFDAKITLDDLAVCLQASGDWTAHGWRACVEAISPFMRSLIGPNGRCETVELPRFSWAEIVDRAAADNQDRLNRAWISLMVVTIIASPVAPPFNLGKLLPHLCALSVGWGCPDSPHYPTPGTTPPSGGDVQ